MQRLVCFLPFLFFTFVIHAQSGTKVSWIYTAKKMKGNQYEVRLSATIQPGWHLYSQNQSKDAIALPTAIRFKPNPFITLTGGVTESGKLYDEIEKATRSKSRFYKERVEFIQLVTLKGKAKTAVSGEVEFMVCDDKQCLPPEIVKFSVRL